MDINDINPLYPQTLLDPMKILKYHQWHWVYHITNFPDQKLQWSCNCNHHSSKVWRSSSRRLMPFSFTQQLSSYSKLGYLEGLESLCQDGPITKTMEPTDFGTHVNLHAVDSFDTTIFGFHRCGTMHKAESIHGLLHLPDRSSRFRMAVMTVGC